MTTLARRTALQGILGMAVVGAIGPSFAQAAQAAPALTGADLEVLRNRWVDTLTGRHLIPASPEMFAAAIATMDRATDRRLALVNPTPTQFFSGYNWAASSVATTNSNAMRMNFVELQSLAVAWATPGSAHEGSARVLATVRQGLAHMHEHVYNTETQWWGNWWSWIIGATRPVSDIMAIMHGALDQAEIDTCCAAMDHFLPDRDPRMQLSSAGPTESEGANRVDICQAFIVRSIVQPDTALLQASVAALSPTWQYVTSGNGFFKDGSFIQHSTIGYTGTYGVVLLTGLSKLFALLAGTTFDITDETSANLTSAVEGSFAPFMFNGYMMDAVRGRAVSRFGERGVDNGNQLIENILRLAESADPETSARWRGLCRQWIESNSTPTITATTNIPRLALVTDLMASDVAPRPDDSGPRFFPAMDRLVHRGRDNTWALCVAMCSSRIAWHEGSAGENFRGVKTSQGMTYLYLADDDRHFDDEFWATSDLEAPAGTTVDLTPLGDNPEGQWGATTPANEWTGGVTLGDLGVAGMHLVAPGDTGLVARKSWFVLPDMVVALGSDVSTESSAEVRTVVEHRNLGETARALTVDGVSVTAEQTLTRATWAHLDGVGGYVFLDQSSPLLAGVAEREGTWRRNNTGTGTGTDVVKRRHFATLAYTHGSGSAVTGSSYAYAVLPGADPAGTRAVSQEPGVEILRNDATAQAVAVGEDLVAANFWAPATIGQHSVSGPASLAVRTLDQRIDVAVSDPTQAQDSLVLTVEGGWVRRVTGPDAARVQMRRKGSIVTLTLDVTDTSGRALEFSLGH